MQDTPFVRVLLSREGPVWSTVTLAYRDTPTNGVSYTGGAILRGPVLSTITQVYRDTQTKGVPCTGGAILGKSWYGPQLLWSTGIL